MATVTASMLAVHQGGLGLWYAAPLTGLGVLPLVLLRHLADRCRQAESTAS